ncbi:MAG: alpha amylase C-terminal domain-containing protein, partial [Lachnospiraceae bacterium]|nr:alpha amylase C-terminal domain-containing protein [Lachnospiraceae bacterium]
WNEFYKKHPALFREDFLEQGFEWISTLDADHSIIVFMRKSEEDKEKLLVVMNFTPVVYENFKVGVPYEGLYKEIFNSDKKDFGGMGFTNGRRIVSKPMPWDGKENSITLNVPPLGISVFEYTER